MTMSGKATIVIVIFALFASSAIFVSNAISLGNADTTDTATTEKEDEVNPTYAYCPKNFGGSMNGIYYYYSVACSDCGSIVVSTSRMHTIDGLCAGGCGSSDCTDGFNTTNRGDDDNSVPPRGWDYVPRKTKNAKNPYPFPNTRFCVGDKSVVKYNDDDDAEVVAVDNDGRKHFFRLIFFTVNLKPYYFGQEIDPGDFLQNEAGVTLVKFQKDPEQAAVPNQKLQFVHIVTYPPQTGQPYYVISKRRFQITANQP
jgi:hypothetical protein